MTILTIMFWKLSRIVHFEILRLLLKIPSIAELLKRVTFIQ